MASGFCSGDLVCGVVAFQTSSQPFVLVLTSPRVQSLLMLGSVCQRSFSRTGFLNPLARGVSLLSALELKVS